MSDILSFYKKILTVAENKTEYWLLNGRNVLYFPIVVPHGVKVFDMLENIFQKYINLLCNENARNVFSQTDVNDISEVCNLIKLSLQKYLSGDIIEAYAIFSKLLTDKCIGRFPLKNVEKNILFFRMRSDFDVTDKKGFYHLPSTLRSKCSSERYSISGYPCFYLGYSKNDCYLEIGPNGSMISLCLDERFNFRVLDLTFFEDQMKGRMIEDFVRVWPVVAACNLVLPKADTDNMKFREEYVIPQMLTAYLKHHHVCDGICYYSVRNENLNPSGTGEDDYRNIVLFPDIKARDEYDDEMMDMFRWFKPFNVGQRP